MAQYDTTFQFSGTFIRTGRKVNSSAIFPESGPVLGGSLPGLFGSRHFRRRIFRSKGTSKCQDILFGGKHKIVFLFFSERCFALPTNRYIIGSGIQGTFQYNLLFILTDNGRRVLIIRSPVASIITMATCRIRETEIDAGMRFRSNGGSHHIGFRMTGGLYLKRFAIQFKATIDDTFPKVQFLFYIRHLRHGKRITSKFKAHHTEVQAMGIDTEPVGSLFLPAVFIELHRIRFHTSATKIIIFQCFLVPVPFGVCKFMPAPLALCSQRHPLRIHFGECLQTGSIYRKGKLAIAYRKGS